MVCSLFLYIFTLNLSENETYSSYGTSDYPSMAAEEKDTSMALIQQQTLSPSYSRQPKEEVMDPLDNKDAILTQFPLGAPFPNTVAKIENMDIADDLEISESDDDDEDDDGDDEDVNEGEGDDDDDEEELYEDTDDDQKPMVDLPPDQVIKKEEGYNDNFNADLNQNSASLTLPSNNSEVECLDVKVSLSPPQSLNQIYGGEPLPTGRADEIPLSAQEASSTVAVKEVKVFETTEKNSISNASEDNDNDDDGWMRF